MLHKVTMFVYSFNLFQSNLLYVPNPKPFFKNLSLTEEKRNTKSTETTTLDSGHCRHP
jgi:hypothetical protein